VRRHVLVYDGRVHQTSIIAVDRPEHREHNLQVAHVMSKSSLLNVLYSVMLSRCVCVCVCVCVCARASKE
jgi:hypothetical protein